MGTIVTNHDKTTAILKRSVELALSHHSDVAAALGKQGIPAEFGGDQELVRALTQSASTMFGAMLLADAINGLADKLARSAGFEASVVAEALEALAEPLKDVCEAVKDSSGRVAEAIHSTGG
jgi:hypothetical protein